MSKLWGGRFSCPPDRQVELFSASHAVDRRLYREDIELNTAYATALHAASVLTQKERDLIHVGLADVQRAIEEGRVEFTDAMEDIHTHIEYWLTQKIGDVAKKLHTGKSRNDQVATDVRMYLMRVLFDIQHLLRQLTETIHDRICSLDIPMSGYTHLQRAQPVTLSLHFGAYIDMFHRDSDRLEDALKRIKIMPLGSGALAGNPFIEEPITTQLARMLGFERPAENSMDAVSDRDFVVETLSALSLIMVHLSRLGEELVLWSTEEFGYITIGDAFTTGSSLMPQKKNPDVAELVRGKCGRVCGNLSAMLMLLKGLPLTYNRDMQEDKSLLFDAVDTVTDCLTVMTSMLNDITFHEKRLGEGTKGFVLATKVAEYLVGKKVPFREAHGVVGRLVALCIEKGYCEFSQLTLPEFQSISPVFKEDIFKYI